VIELLQIVAGLLACSGGFVTVLRRWWERLLRAAHDDDAVCG
jgi:hypothetical protein